MLSIHHLPVWPFILLALVLFELGTWLIKKDADWKAHKGLLSFAALFVSVILTFASYLITLGICGGLNNAAWKHTTWTGTQYVHPSQLTDYLSKHYGITQQSDEKLWVKGNTHIGITARVTPTTNKLTPIICRL